MKYPLTLSSHKRIVYVPEGWFDAIGKLDPEKMELSIGISNLGESGLEWFLDYDGKFYELIWLSKLPKKFVNYIGLKKQREIYSISAPRDITVEELEKKVSDHTNQFEEAPDTTNLKNILSKKPKNEVVAANLLKELYGQETNA